MGNEGQLVSERKTESVWDYPRPPRLEISDQRVRVEFAGVVMADSIAAYRVLETSHPPTFYIPPADVRLEHLLPTTHRSWCEWKGKAQYWSIRIGDRISENGAWSYADPTAPFTAIQDHLAFYPARVDACFVADERVVKQDGDFYGGWITSNIRGPIKGGPGTLGW